jgi:outer membrane lipoprotein-sorting protein
MRPTENIEKLVRKLRYKASDRTRQRILGNVVKALENNKEQNSDATAPNIWRIIMKSKITKLAVAAVIIIAVALSITFLDKSVTPAYAIEQTIEAMRNVITVHFFARDWQNRELETWIKVNPETGGNDCHYLNEPERGQISISTPEITYFYHPKENKVRIVEGQALRSDLRFGRFIEDVLDKIIEPENGEVQITKEHDPNTGEEVIILWAKSSNYEMEAFIDPETNLPIRVNFGKAISGQIIKDIYEIYYNDPLPEGLFDFKIPEGAEVIREQSLLPKIDDPNYGISTDGLSRDEARVRIIEEFWDAIISKGFERAHLLLPVASVEKLQEVLPDVDELISIGEPFEVPHINFGILTPVRVRFSDGKVLELYQITYFRMIDGKSSCVLAGEGKPVKRIE